MTNEKKAKVNPHLVLREEFDDWAVLFDPDSETHSACALPACWFGSFLTVRR